MRRGALASLLALFANPLVLILLAAAVVSGFLRDAVGVLLVVTIVGLSAAVAFYGFLCVAILTYLGLVEVAKRALRHFSRGTVAFAAGR